MGRNAQFDGIDAGNVTALVTEEVRKRLRERHDPSHYAASSPAAPVDDELITKEQDVLIANCTIMKRALFNAGKRLERKHAAGQFTFALSGVYGFLVPLFTLQFEPFLTALVTYVISFTAATAGAVSFVVAMLYQQKDLARRARLFYEAGRQINKLGKDLKVIRFTETAELRRFMHHYDEILARAEKPRRDRFRVCAPRLSAT